MTHITMNQQPHDPRHLDVTNYTTKDKPSTTGRAGAPTGALTHSNFSTGGPVGTNTGVAHAPTSAMGTRTWQSEAGAPVVGSLEPPVLTTRGKWEQEALPTMVLPSQAQMLTAVGLYSSADTLKRTNGRPLSVLGDKAIGSIHTYADVSPLVATECVHDTKGWANRTSEAWNATALSMTTQNEAAAATIRAKREAQGHAGASLWGGSTLGSGSAGGDRGPKEARDKSVNEFWARSGAAATLGSRDLARSGNEPISVRQGPYSNNARLVGSRWRYMERPQIGQALYTDFYGCVAGGKTSDYYGRSYHYTEQ